MCIRDREEEIRNLPNAVYSTYGMTETLSHIALRRLNGAVASDRYYPFSSVELSLSSEDTLMINAPLVCDETLQTNDIARIYPDGSFTILGRKDNVINSGGIKIQAEEIEKLLQSFIPCLLYTSYIRRQLLSLGIRSTESGPYPAYAGALSHLKTDFHFSLKDNKNLGDLLKVLHPTPAVCGLPKEEAYRFILENEGYDRKYYSGFIGWLDPEGRTDLYVNLRCMHIEDEQLTLYAGGGLLASSELNDEWQETEKKLQTMRRILVSAPIMMNH